MNRKAFEAMTEWWSSLPKGVRTKLKTAEAMRRAVMAREDALKEVKDCTLRNWIIKLKSCDADTGPDGSATPVVPTETSGQMEHDSLPELTGPTKLSMPENGPSHLPADIAPVGNASSVREQYQRYLDNLGFHAKGLGVDRELLKQMIEGGEGV